MSKNSMKTAIQLRKEREKENRRKEIIKAAEKVFLSKGFDESTMIEIAKEAVLSKGTIYNYFNSKEELYLVIGTDSNKILNNMFEKALLKPKTDIEKIKSLGYAYYQFSQEYPEYSEIMHDMGSRFSSNFAPTQDQADLILNRSEIEYYKEINRTGRIFNGVISKAISNDSIRSDLPPPLIAIALSSLTSGLISELSHRETILKMLGINSKDIIELVFKWIAEGLKPKVN